MGCFGHNGATLDSLSVQAVTVYLRMQMRCCTCILRLLSPDSMKQMAQTRMPSTLCPGLLLLCPHDMSVMRVSCQHALCTAVDISENRLQSSYAWVRHIIVSQPNRAREDHPLQGNCLYKTYEGRSMKVDLETPGMHHSIPVRA